MSQHKGIPEILNNGVTWLDTDGNPIHCHGGHIIKFGSTFYWYGEDRRADAYVSCYTSEDLLNWKFKGNILTAFSKTEDLFGYNCSLLINGKKINIERPKIVYNPKTKKYIMWAHYENGNDYCDAAIAIASCDTPDGDFVYHGFFRPFNNMSRDCNVFFENGKMYFASASNENKDLHIYQMNSTYTGVEKLVQKVFVGKSREAPAFFHFNGKTYVITSQCTGWCPNQSGYAFADTIESNWSKVYNFGDATTYHSQSTSVLTLELNGKTQYIYIADRWGGNQWDGKTINDFEYLNSTYYFSLIKTNKDGSISLIDCDKFTIDLNNDGFKIISN